VTQVSYVLEVREQANWHPHELHACLTLLADGGAVDLRFASRLLPLASSVSFARYDGEIVGLAALKTLRIDYIESISSKSGFQLSADSLELGYVVVSEHHRGKGLGTSLVSRLIEIARRPLFATTYERTMIRMLAAQGFEVRGGTWKSRHGELISLLTRNPKKIPIQGRS
jgi:GNAT superfamily N-acetyltransferase